MEVNNSLFIPIEIIEIIYKNIDDFNIKKNFCLINKIIYKKFYKNIDFYLLERNVDVNYLKFYNLLQKYDYQNEDINYLKKIISKSLHFNIIWKNNQNGFIDTRYIFELMFHFDIINKYFVKLNNKYFYKHFYKNIKQCIVKNNRQETLLNIEKHKLCTVLKKNFIPNSTKNTEKWIYLSDN